MHLPINIDNILHGKTVEWQRLEFKKSWNPESILHTMCAFANDIHNLGGGYIIIGIEEKNGCPVMPPYGIDENQVDKIQKEILRFGYNYIQPSYHPVIVPYVIQDRTILVIWVPGGHARPYKAREKIGIRDSKEYRYFIRRGSSTVRAKGIDEKDLLKLAENVPFDDRMNYKSSMNDLEFGLIKEFLYKIDSDLKDNIDSLNFEKLCRQMRIVDGPMEMRRPLNVGLMFFNENPDNFFPYTQIDVIHFPEGPGGDVFFEKIFKGPLWKSLSAALDYIKNSIVVEHVIKYSDRAEADRIYNVPYPAIEESLVNVIYHRSYEIREPVEVRILPEKLIIKSFPGPEKSINIKDLQNGHGTSQEYRNRRIGDFLKELDLTEGRGTGIPKILKAMKANGSPKAVFETDENHTFFLTILPIHTKTIKLANEIKKDRLESRLESMTIRMLKKLKEKELSRKEIALYIGHKGISGALNKGIKFLLDNKYIEHTIPEKPHSRLQKYRITKEGELHLKD